MVSWSINNVCVTIEDFSVCKGLEGSLEFCHSRIAILDTVSQIGVEVTQSRVNPTVYLYPFRVPRVTSDCGCGLDNTSKLVVSTEHRGVEKKPSLVIVRNRLSKRMIRGRKPLGNLTNQKQCKD